MENETRYLVINNFIQVLTTAAAQCNHAMKGANRFNPILLERKDKIMNDFRALAKIQDKISKDIFADLESTYDVEFKFLNAPADEALVKPLVKTEDEIQREENGVQRPDLSL